MFRQTVCLRIGVPAGTLFNKVCHRTILRDEWIFPYNPIILADCKSKGRHFLTECLPLVFFFFCRQQLIFPGLEDNKTFTFLAEDGSRTVPQGGRDLSADRSFKPSPGLNILCDRKA